MGTDSRAGLPPGANRLVYTMYRDMLKNYNDRANEILETKPAGCVSEDRGIADLVHSMARQLSSGAQMSSETPAERTNGSVPIPPPPPPPPIAGASVPAIRLKSELSNERRPIEPPACVQNAMMTKDKKPFTYTPGGLDLSQIRSPRMARRLTRNAMSEGVQAQQALPPSTSQQQQESAISQQREPVIFQQQPRQVLPPPPPQLQQVPPPPQLQQVLPPPPPPPQQQRQQILPQQQQQQKESVILPQKREVVASQQPPLRKPTTPQEQQKEPVILPQQREVIISQPVVREAQQQRDRIPGPTVTPVTVQVLTGPPSASAAGMPENARRPINEPRAQVGSIYVPPLSADEAQRSLPNSPGTPVATLNKAPTPWLTGGRTPPQRQEAPAWVRATPPASATPPTSATPPASATERIIPIQIECSSGPQIKDERSRQPQPQQRPQFQAQRQQSQQQQQQQQLQQQQLQQQQLQQQQLQQQQQQQQQQRQHVVRVIPIQIEGRRTSGQDNGSESPAIGAPVQSPAFRVLERVTSRDEELHSQPAVEHPATVGHAFYRGQQQAQQQAQQRRDQREPEPRKYTGASIPSRSFQMLQAMVAPENCAADGTRADEHTGGDCPGSATDTSAHPCPVPPWGHEPISYWHDPYWSYMAHTPSPGGGGTGADNGYWYPPPPPHWDPYMAAYWFGYWPPCTPHPPYMSASDTDDYSSTDEMGRYGLAWPQQQAEIQPQPHAPADDDVEPDRTGLQAIRSVSDIKVYNEAPGTINDRRTATDNETEHSSSASSSSSSPSLSAESSDEEGDIEGSECATEEGVHVPHQLSVIFEESEVSDLERRRREVSVATTASEDDSSATVAVNTAAVDTDDSCIEDGNPEDWDGTCETTVTVRLPLRLKFGKSVNGTNDVTEVVVGDSEVRSSGDENRSIVPFLHRQRSDDTVENYETAESDTDTLATERKFFDSTRSLQATNNKISKPAETNSDDEDNEDSDDDSKINDDADKNDNEINDDNDINDNNAAEVEDNDIDTKINNEDSDNDNDTDSNDDDEVCQDDNFINNKRHLPKTSSDSEDKHTNSTNSLDEICCDKEKNKNTDAAIINPIIDEPRAGVEIDTGRISVRQRVLAIEGQTSIASVGDEDMDSGVTSDVSRHTDTELDCASESLQHKYQRAATHSRLYKLLQDECSKSDDEEEDEDNDVEERLRDGREACTEGESNVVTIFQGRNNIGAAKKPMWLPLNGSDPESFSSSGVCSPASPSWVARELVRGLYTSVQHEDALSNTSEDGSPLDSCYSSDYRSYFNSWERAAARARCPRIRAHSQADAASRQTVPSPSPTVAQRQAAGAS